ncbi:MULTISPECIES: DUF5316 family protein [Bacillales]|uniref:DUF5316 family protein n=1 Tax=Lysinibacillus louembei TaxID=1470088 RepID=A0ABZ0RZG4_9BACI|nr:MULTISPECIES: DUF5316 family protein [Bacillales]MCT6926297.1 DUF5316 domain-containing protein [Metasolibacillus sp.]MCT6942535.1 DUF5316 domain-containing protein [Metasolibacillus sp.]WPK13647.1 DUF5316 family protein [Lysinibacillus louembei]
MKIRYFLYGIMLALGSIIIAFILGDVQKVIRIAGTIGGILLILTMFFSGVFVNGDRLRANLATESSEQKNRRHRYEEIFLFMSLPCLIVAAIFYYIF